MIKRIFPILLAISVFSCGTKKAATGDKKLYEVLTQQTDGGGNIRFFEILSKPEEIKMIRGDENIKRKILDEEVTESNFLIMNMGEKSTGGYMIGVESMEETNDKIIITVKETEPKPGDMVTQNITYPYCVIKINSKKPIDVK